ncbi:DUF982 domain-containing protein [Mesorhizobium sp. L-8-3]|uniref:DUF982 domain-containing protein n=1 Tax=Mesorhizobium sp. L-8-3 TaxID=2744522 RepID=UPI001927A3BC|nr:DUF982 domain-containing protein [Mesorhizobium sp. L-8-3]BCH25766.1 hypothetical protein MesoLjLb_55510 [Mesorhizobium sp. L-8-3]
MNRKNFARAVFLRNGERLRREVTCVGEALAFLAEWPQARRGPIYNAASRACEAAQRGEIPASYAYEAFTGFARAANILDQAPVEIEPWIVTSKPGRGGIPA